VHVLITGATGFIGSSLAAAFVDRGARVTCLARGADGAERTLGAVARAAAGFGLPIDPSRIQVLPYEAAAIERHAAQLADLTAVWHCAAHMTFAYKKLRDAIDVNVGGTVALLQQIARLARHTPRFYFCSTAYTGGVEAGQIGETLHLTPHLLNPYFVSKWGAELVLEKLARDHVLPVTVYRPTLVVGHSQTGWYGGQSYGLYNFVDAVSAGRLAGGSTMRLDIATTTEHNYVPIDDVVNNAVALTGAASGRQPFEVMIEAGTDNPNSDRVAWIAEGLGLRLEFGRPRTIADHVVDVWIAVNKPFNQPEAGVRPFPFNAANLGALLGPAYSHHVMDRQIHLTLVRWYRDHRLPGIDRDAGRRLPVRLVRLAHASGLHAVLPRRLAAQLVAREVARAHGIL
jgi:nucleoside-diphosphate-sugar epimerase